MRTDVAYQILGVVVDNSEKYTSEKTLSMVVSLAVALFITN
jgi:hypothetical protein